MKNNLLAELKMVLLKYPCSHLFQHVRLIISLSHSPVSSKRREFILISMVLLFPAHKNERIFVLALETHFACVSGTHKPTKYGIFPSLSIHHISLMEFGKDLWVTLSICHLSPWGETPQHRCPKMEQGSLEAEVSTWCISCSFHLRCQEESSWHKLCELPIRNTQDCPEEL